MKRVSRHSMVILSVAMWLCSCQKSPEIMAEKYMNLVCRYDQIQADLAKSQTEPERLKLEANQEKIFKEMTKLNNQILEQYQGDAEAMEIIRNIAANYQCNEN